MTLTLELTPAEERELQDRAAREGVNVEEYARRRVLPASVTGRGTKSYRALQFSGVAPRPLAKIEAHIADVEASRNEWDERDGRSAGLPEKTEP